MCDIDNSIEMSSASVDLNPADKPPVILITGTEVVTQTENQIKQLTGQEKISPKSIIIKNNNNNNNENNNNNNNENNNNDITYEKITIIKANLNSSHNDRNNNERESIISQEKQQEEDQINKENNNNNHHQLNSNSISKKSKMDIHNAFPLANFVDPPEMCDEDQMFAAFNHFQIIWSDLSYKIEPKWYKKYNFLNRLLGGCSSSSSSNSSQQASSSANSTVSSDTAEPTAAFIQEHANMLRESCSVISSVSLVSEPDVAHSSIKTHLGPLAGTSGAGTLATTATTTTTNNQTNDSKTIEIFSNLNGTIKSGQLTAILGPSGKFQYIYTNFC